MWQNDDKNHSEESTDNEKNYLAYRSKLNHN